MIILFLFTVTCVNAFLAFDPLPYALNALEPYMSQQQLTLHFLKHHRGYVDKAEGLLAAKNKKKEGGEEAWNTLRVDISDVPALIAAAPKKGVLWNALSQHWNHAFFWNSMVPRGGGGAPPAGSQLRSLIEAHSSWKSFDGFRKAFREAVMSVFGSGWVWLVVAQNGQLDIVTTLNAGPVLPQSAQGTPLLNVDVWEHAYYVDYENRRSDFIDAFLDHLVNWSFAKENLERHFAKSVNKDEI
jgi:superoxide dismutase, Fe-Mn family